MNSKITHTRHVLAVQDLAKSVAYYQNQLGFSTDWTDDGWHALSREKFTIMLGECREDVSAFETNNHSYFAYIEVTGIDVLYKELQTREIEITSGLVDKPYGQREFAIQTIDGHRIMFGETIHI